jgi:hypothetical protein
MEDAMAASTLGRVRYEDDYYAWAREQAAALRGLAAERWNGPLDLENLAEEVEDLARRDRKAVLSQTERILEHLLKLQYSAQQEPRRGWENSVDDARGELDKDLTPTLRRELAEALPGIYAKQRERTARRLRRSGDDDAAGRLPQRCPYTLEQILDEDWWPSTPEGAAGGPASPGGAELR